MVRQILFVTFMVRIFKKIGKHWLDPDKIKYIYPFLATNIGDRTSLAAEANWKKLPVLKTERFLQSF